MRAGPLDRIITLRSPSAGSHNGYTKVDSFADAGVRSAALMPMSPREGMEAQQRTGRTVSRFLVRSDSLTRTVNAKWKLTYSGAAYDVIGVIEDGRNDGLIIEAVASDRDI